MGPETIGVVVAVAALVSAVVPEDKLPGWARKAFKVVNWLGLNVGNARNDPAAQKKLGGGAG